jgi:hypothetical protein
MNGMQINNASHCILVQGMHRSGTSALTGVLSLLGVNLGTTLLEAQEEVNPKGFWEHAAVVDLHDELLGSLHSGWWDTLPLPDGWLSSPAAMHCQEELQNILDKEFSESRLWAIKDPRSCRLIPLWKNCMPGISMHHILMLRHPAEVAASLNHRDGFCTQMSALLWLRNVLESERSTRDQSRLAITFDDLLSDWRTTLGRVAGAFGIALPLGDSPIASKIDAFLEPQLRHHIMVQSDASTPPMALAVEAYQALQAQDVERLDAIHSRFEQEVLRHEPWLKQTNELMLKLQAGKGAIQTSRDEATAMAAEATAKTTEVEACRREIQRILSTPSWRITAPLRTIANFFRRS